MRATYFNGTDIRHTQRHIIYAAINAADISLLITGSLKYEDMMEFPIAAQKTRIIESI